MADDDDDWPPPETDPETIENARSKLREARRGFWDWEPVRRG